MDDRTPSLVYLREPNHQRPYRWTNQQGSDSLKLATHHEKWEETGDDECIQSEHPEVVPRLNDPSRKSETHAELLLAIRVTVFLEILACLLVGQSFVRFREAHKVGFRLLLGLVYGELDLVRMADADGSAAVS